MFATKFDRDTALSVNMVSLSTLFSLITMPLIVGLAQTLGINSAQPAVYVIRQASFAFDVACLSCFCIILRC